MQYCYVPKCKAKCCKNKKLKFHKFPCKVKNKKLHEKWVQKIRKIPSSDSNRVCELHFTPDDYQLSKSGINRVLKCDAVPSLKLPTHAHEIVRSSKAIPRAEQRSKRFQNRSQPPNPLHSEQLFLPVNADEVKDDLCEIEIKIEPDFEERNQNDIITNFKCGFCSQVFSSTADVHDHINQIHRSDKPTQKSAAHIKPESVELESEILTLSDQDKLIELFTRLSNFNWCHCKTCVSHCRMFFDHITSTHADLKSPAETDDMEIMEMSNESDCVDLYKNETTTDDQQLIFQEKQNGDVQCYVCPICEAEIQFDNVLGHMQTHDANSSYALEIEPAPGGALDDHCYVNDEFFNGKDINLTLRKTTTQQSFSKSASVHQVVERIKPNKSNIPGIYSWKKCGDGKMLTCNIIVDDGSMERIPPVPNIVKVKINSLMKSESGEKIVEYHCGLCGNTYYKKDVILKCLELHLSNGWTEASSAEADRQASNNDDSGIISITPILPNTLKKTLSDLQQVIPNDLASADPKTTAKLISELAPTHETSNKSLPIADNIEFTALKCEPCGKIFSLLIEIKEHVKLCHDESSVLMRTEDAEIRHLFKCLLCKNKKGQYAIFKTLADSMKHRSEKHKYYAKPAFNQFFRRIVIQPDGTDAEVTEDLPYYEKDCIVEEFRCVCNEVYTLKPKAEKCYWQHIGIKRFKCEENRTDNVGPCDLKFYTKEDLSSHVERVHRTPVIIPRIVCDVCGKSVQQPKMKQHTQRHVKKQRKLCVLCGKWYPSEDRLKIHIMVVHKKPQRYRCDVCFKRFEKKAHAELCIAMHGGGVKKYHCEHCEKSFLTRLQLRNHKYHKSVTSKVKSEVLSISCEMCEYSTKCEEQLERHVRLEHDEDSD